MVYLFLLNESMVYHLELGLSKKDCEKEKQLVRLEQQKKIKIHRWKASISGLILFVDWEISNDWQNGNFYNKS